MEHYLNKDSYWYQDGYCIPPMWSPCKGKELDERCKKKISEAVTTIKKDNGVNQHSKYYNPEEGSKFEDEECCSPLILFVKDRCLYAFHEPCQNPENSIVPDMVLEDYTASIVPGEAANKAVKEQYGVTTLKLVRCGEIFIDKFTAVESFLCTEWEGQLLPLQDGWQESIEEGYKVELLKIPLNRMDEYNFEMKTYCLLDFAQANYLTWATVLYHAGVLDAG